jgi:hypothetical protein
MDHGAPAYTFIVRYAFQTLPEKSRKVTGKWFPSDSGMTSIYTRIPAFLAVQAGFRARVGSGR